MIDPACRLPGAVLLSATLCLLLAGCASAGAGQKAELFRVDAPLREPLWVPEKEVLLALDEDHRQVVRVDVGGAAPGSRAPIRSREFGDAGENLDLSPEEPDLAYLASPESGRIFALDTDSLRVERGYDVGGAPSYVTLDVQPEILFALSEDGSEVSGVDVETARRVPAVEVGGSTQTLAEAPEKGADPAFWTAGPGGVAFYGGDPPQRLTGKRVEADDIAVDLESSQRAYLAWGSEVVALEGDPEGLLEGKLETVAARDFGEKVERVACDELFVYAVTEDKLVVMRRETLEPVETVEFGRLFEEEGISPAGVSGMTAGSGAKEVYLTLEGAPYVLGVEKP